MGRAQNGSEVPTWQHSPDAKGKQVASGLNGYYEESHASNHEISATWDKIARAQPPQAMVGNSDVEAYGTYGLDKAARINDSDAADVLKPLQDPNAAFWTEMPEDEIVPYTISEADMRVVEDLVRRIDNAMASKPGFESGISAAKRGQPFASFSSISMRLKTTMTMSGAISSRWSRRRNEKLHCLSHLVEKRGLPHAD
jgi:hypothetical protein